MDARGGLPADGARDDASPRARDEDNVGVVVHDLLDGDDGGVGDEGLRVHRDTPSGATADLEGIIVAQARC